MGQAHTRDARAAADHRVGSPAPPTPLVRLSVVIPTLNEAACIQATISSVRRQPGVREVIVVDGGSCDRTVALARASGATKVLKCQAGRGTQLDAGWRRASKASEWCLFLHADTQLPADFSRLLAAAVQPKQQQQQQSKQQQQQRPRLAPHQQLNQQRRLRQPCWGCASTIQLTQVPAWQAWLVRNAVELRTRLLQQPYGDQALFVQRSALEAIQGFPHCRLLEDVAVVEQLRQLSPPAILPAPVVTSGRLYQSAGFWEVVGAHQCILLARSAGWSPDRLAHWRERALRRRQPASSTRPCLSS